INESRRSEMTEKLLEIEKKYSEAVSFLGPANIQAIASREEQEKLAHESVSNAKPRALHSDKNNKLDKARSCLRQHDFGKAAALYERFLDEDDELAAAEAELVLNYVEYRKVREAGDFKLMIEPCAALTESIIFYADNCEIDRDFASIIAELAVNLFSIPFDYSFSNMRKIHNYQNAPFFSIDIKHITPPLKKDFFEYKLPKAFAYFITEVIFADDEELQNPLERWKFDLCVAINNIDNYTNSAIRHQAGNYYVSDFELADSASYQRFYENRDKVYAFLKENGLLKAPSVQSQLATVLVLLLMSLPGIFVIYLFITHEVFK
nr:hypothetical protein [bacterium]